MATKLEIRQRREIVAEHLSHHIVSPILIKRELDVKYPELTVEMIENDIRIIKKSSTPWLVGLAKNGYIYDVMLGIRKLKQHEAELENMKRMAKDWKDKREIIKQIDESVISRLSLEGEGPVFLAITNRK